MYGFVSRLRRLIGKTPVIGSGPGEGLRFDAGASPDLFSAGAYERPVQQALVSLAAPGGVFYDVGANSGFFSVLLGRAVGANGRVYAFEPVARNAALIEKNARLNGLRNIDVLPIACSDEPGRRDLLLAEHDGGATLSGAGIPNDFVGRCAVEVSTIDELLATKRISVPDLIKIDVEGAEIQVLRGMRKLLSAHAPALVIEFDDETEEGCRSRRAECTAFLQALGFGFESLPDSYPDIRWCVQHIVARKGRGSP